MDAAERQLMRCLRAYRLGEETAGTETLSAADWRRLAELAEAQKLTAVVFETLWRCPDFCGGDRQLLLSWKRDTLLQASAQAARSRRIAELSARLTGCGVGHALLKGLLCRELYTRPDLRISGDEDLFIRESDRDRASDVLKASGLQLLPEWSSDSVTHWTEPGGSLHVELHTRLFSGSWAEEAGLNRLFRESLDRTVTAETGWGPVSAPAPEDHFFFLVCHALKHFLSGGFGVRTLCDVVSFAQCHRAEISFDRTAARLEAVRGRIFLDQLFAAGERWLGFDPAALGWQYVAPPEPEALVADCLEAGIYGQSSMSRKHSAGMVLHSGEGRPALSGVLFPPREQLLRRYPELERRPELLPVCWLRRLGSYGLELLHSGGRGNSPLESVALGKKRTEMMVRYGIFPKSKRKN